MIYGHNEKSSKLWVISCWLVLSLFSLYLIFSLYQATVVNYDKSARAASQTQWLLLPYTAQRGVIYDASGIQLASNTYDYTIVCSPNAVLQSLGDSTDADLLAKNSASLRLKLHAWSRHRIFGECFSRER